MDLSNEDKQQKTVSSNVPPSIADEPDVEIDEKVTDDEVGVGMKVTYICKKITTIMMKSVIKMLRKTMPKNLRFMHYDEKANHHQRRNFSF